jgi:hypothetical protein
MTGAADDDPSAIGTYATWKTTLYLLRRRMDPGRLLLLEERAEAKRQLVAVAAQFRAASTALETLAQALTRLKQAGFRTGNPLALLDAYADLLEFSTLRRLIREYRAIAQRIEHMDKATHEMGID